ncbi:MULTISPECIES: hypothetical protein [Methylomonas]|uniref:hypothetical protein n=1 Tax=Methylomonas TaxID=416 RepID=UPI0012329B5F|nr:hypothetical protein [Methylomonas rhizoryzae]
MNEKNQQFKNAPEQDHGTHVDESKRRFAKRGAALAPVIMTLANKSSWAGEFCVANQSVNGIVSFANQTNSYTTATPNTEWKTPEEWETYLDTNPPPSIVFPTGYHSIHSVLMKLESSDAKVVYMMASQLNDANYGGFPEVLTSGNATVSEYETFYDACVAP